MSNPEKNNPNYQSRKREVRDGSCRPFIQIDAELPSLLTNAELKLYIHVKKRAGSVDGKCWESIDHMAIETKMSANTIRRCAKSLLSKNLVKRTKRPGTTDLYELTPPSDWVFITNEPLIKVAHLEPNPAQNCTPTPTILEPNPAQNCTPTPTILEPNPAQNCVQIRSPEIYSKELDPHEDPDPETRKREGARDYFADSKSLDPENPETATDRRQDSDLEPLCKAKPIQNPEPETADRDCPSQPISTQPQTFRNSEQNLSYRAEATKNQSPAISNLEETNIPPAAAGNLPQEAASTPTEALRSIAPNSSALTGRFSGGSDPLGDRFKISGSWRSRKPLLDQAIAAYDQVRHSSWGKAPKAPNSVLYMALDAVYRRLVADEVADPEQEFLVAIASATLWVGGSDFHTKPGFGNKDLNWLTKQPQRVLELADKWHSKSQDEKVGTAIKITQSAGEKQYFDLQGKSIQYAWARMQWKDISRRARADKEITKAEKDWANHYFPQYDIYLEHEDI